MNNKYLIEKINNFYKKAKIDLESLKYLEKFITSEKDPKFFFTMTSINKIGINPQSQYNTPIGIYSYPLTQEYYEKLIKSKLPFAGNQRYINLFSISDSVNNLSYYDNLSSDYKKLSQIYDNIEEVAKNAFDTAYKKNIVSKFWNLTRILSKTPIKWNALLRNLGYTNFYDPGDGIIHTNEPTQFVVLDPRIIIPIESFENPFNENNKIHNLSIPFTANLKEEDINNILKSKNYSRITNMLESGEQKIKPYQMAYLFKQDFKPSEFYEFLRRIYKNKYLKDDERLLKFILYKTFTYDDVVEEVFKIMNNYDDQYVFSDYGAENGISIDIYGVICFHKDKKIHNISGPAKIYGKVKKYYYEGNEYPSIDNDEEWKYYLNIIQNNDNK
jgi:hypothetical protein